MKGLKIILGGIMLSVGLVSQCLGYSDLYGLYTIDYGTLTYSIGETTTGDAWVNATAGEGVYPIEINTEGWANSVSMNVSRGSITVTATRQFTISHPYLRGTTDMPLGIKGNWGYNLWGKCSGNWSGFTSSKQGWAAITTGSNNIINEWPKTMWSISRGPFEPGEESAEDVYLIDTLSSNPVYLEIGVPYYLITQETAELSAWGVFFDTAQSKVNERLLAKVEMAIPEPNALMLLSLGLPVIMRRYTKFGKKKG